MGKSSWTVFESGFEKSTIFFLNLRIFILGGRPQCWTSHLYKRSPSRKLINLSRISCLLILKIFLTNLWILLLVIVILYSLQFYITLYPFCWVISNILRTDITSSESGKPTVNSPEARFLKVPVIYPSSCSVLIGDGGFKSFQNYTISQSVKRKPKCWGCTPEPASLFFKFWI